jgi:hypothetical protein
MQVDETESREIPRSQLFLVRVWQEQLGEGEIEWRGRVQNIHSGAVAYFREWDGLSVTLPRLLETNLSQEQTGTSEI